MVVIIATMLSPVPYVPPTPERLTSSTWSYDCELVNEGFERSRLRFHTEGGRGYWAAPGEARATRVRHVIDLDEARVFDGAEQSRFLNESNISGLPRGYRWVEFDGEGRTISVQEITPTMNAMRGNILKASLVLTVDFGARVQRLVGFCAAELSEQQPLSEEETAEILEP
jgi:hypothetical protein